MSCLNTIKQSSSDNFPSPGTSSTSSKSEEWTKQHEANQTSSLSSSMYHSAIGSILLGSRENLDENDIAEEDVASEPVVQSSPRHGASRMQRMPSLRRRYNSSSIQQRLLIAVEKQVQTEVSISEVQLSLSSKG